MRKVAKEVLLSMRDLITEMEPNLDFDDNTILCCNRLGKMMTSVVFNDMPEVVAGQILHYQEDKAQNVKMTEMKNKLGPVLTQ